MADSPYPDDIDPESGFRLPLPKREDLDDAAKAIFDQLNDPDGRSLVGLKGPGGIRLHSPRNAVPTNALSSYLRWESGFSPQIRELAILVAAREMDSRFEWAAHEPAGLKEGLSQDIIDIVKFRKNPDGLPETETVIITLGRELFRDHRLSSGTYARAMKVFSARELIDLVSLMGQYAATAMLLATFDIQLHPGKQAILPLP